MFKPGHLQRSSQGMPGVPEFVMDIYYEVKHDPKEGKMLHFRMSGEIAGKAFEEQFDLHADTAFNFARKASQVVVKHGMPANLGPIMRKHAEYDQMFEDIRTQLDIKPGDPINLDHLEKDGF